MPYALLIGSLVAFTALIPIFGAFIGCAVGSFLIFMVSPKQAILFIIVFLVLQQLGVGPEKGFGIVDASAVWDDFLPGDERAKTIASYMGAKVRLAFDPPQSSTAMEALKNTVAEMEFRLNIEFDKAES